MSSRETVAGKVKEIGDHIVDGQKALNLTRRLEAFYLPLASAGRLMGVLSAIVQSLVVAMLAAELEIPLGFTIGF